MAGKLKIGTFNCHNLFSRSKVLNRIDEAGAEKLMAKIGRLNDELALTDYNPQHILDLFKEININPDTGKPETMIEIVDMHGKLFGKRRGTHELFVKPKGKGEWDGYISFKKSKFDDETRANTARVIHEMDADILSLIEIEDKSTLDAFNKELIGGKNYEKYPYTMLIDNINDRRGIDVALLSRYPFEEIRTHMYDEPPGGGKPVFSRDCLEVKVKLAEGDYLYFFVNHLKSQGYGSKAENDARRKPQAQRVADIIKERGLDLKTQKTVILGDFNCTWDSDSLSPLFGIKELKDILACAGIPEADCWTYCYQQSKKKRTYQQLDYILISEPLQAAFKAANILRKGIYDLKELTGGADEAWESVQNKNGPWAQASDHAAIWADFSI